MKKVEVRKKLIVAYNKMRRRFLLWYNTYPNWHFFNILIPMIVTGIIVLIIAL